MGVIKGRQGPKQARDRPARRHGRAADRGDDQPAVSLDASRPCTGAATTAIRGSCSARAPLSRRHPRLRRFGGNFVILQAAEEGGGGAKAMLDDGLMENFAIEEVYALHNAPKLPVGENDNRECGDGAPPFSSSSSSKARAAMLPSQTIALMLSSPARRSSRRCRRSSRERRPARFLRRLGGALHRREYPEHSCRSSPSSKAPCGTLSPAVRDLVE